MKNRTSTPDPERCRVRLQSVGEVTQRDGGYVYRALAQAYGIVNDRLMIFRQGSGANTISQRVPTGRVKIHDGHPWDPNSETVIGKVLSATEKPNGVEYQGFISSENAPVATKLSEGVLDENSLELYVLREDYIEVDLNDVPVMARKWAEISSSGKAVVREVQEWMWLAIGLVGSSSQGMRCLIETPKYVPYQDLQLAARTVHWDPEGAEKRVAEWAGLGNPHAAGAATVKQQRAYLARAGVEGNSPKFLAQIADVVNGELVVIPDALSYAEREVEKLMETDPHTAAAAMRTLGRYEQRLLTSRDTLSHPSKDDAANAVPTSQGSAAGPAQPSTETQGSNAETLSAFDSANQRDQELRELKLEALRLGFPGTDPPRSTDHEPSHPGERTA